MYQAPMVFLGVLAGVLLTLGACLWLRRQPGRVAASVGLSLLLGLGPLSLACLAAYPTGDGAVTIVGLGGPALVLLALLIGTPLVWALVTRHWSKALAIVGISLVGHIATGWPQNFAPEYARLLAQQVQQRRTLAQAARKAQPLLDEYGIRLPAGCRVLEAEVTPLREGAFTFPQARLQIGTPRDWRDPRQELRRQLLAQGYRDTPKDDALSGSATLLVKEPYVLDVDHARYQLGRQAVELVLAQDQSGKFLSRWVSGWRQPGS